MADEQAMIEAGNHDGVPGIDSVPPQITATPGMRERRAAGRCEAPLVRDSAHADAALQEAIRDDRESIRIFPAHELADASMAVIGRAICVHRFCKQGIHAVTARSLRVESVCRATNFRVIDIEAEFDQVVTLLNSLPHARCEWEPKERRATRGNRPAPSISAS